MTNLPRRLLDNSLPIIRFCIRWDAAFGFHPAFPSTDLGGGAAHVVTLGVQASSDNRISLVLAFAIESPPHPFTMQSYAIVRRLDISPIPSTSTSFICRCGRGLWKQQDFAKKSARQSRRNGSPAAMAA